MTTERVLVTEEELGALIAQSHNGRAVHCSWGTGELLIETEADRWMLDALKALRGEQ